MQDFTPGMHERTKNLKLWLAVADLIRYWAGESASLTLLAPLHYLLWFCRRGWSPHILPRSTFHTPIKFYVHTANILYSSKIIALRLPSVVSLFQ